MPDLKDFWSGLLAFERAAEHASFTEAARQLGLTPSAISKAVARLERRLGAQLFQRSTRSQSLTAEGRRFFEQVAPLLRRLREAEAAIGSQERITGQIRVSAPIDLGRLLIAGWSTDFAARYPELDLALNVTDRFVDMWREGYDVAIRIGSPPNGTLQVVNLGHLTYAVVAAPSFLKRPGEPRSPEDIEERDRLAYLTTGGQRMAWSFGARRIVLPGQRLETDDGGALRSAALNGAGVAYLFRFAVEADLRSGDLVELFLDLPKTTAPVFAIHPFTSGPPRRVSAFLDFAKQRLAKITARGSA